MKLWDTITWWAEGLKRKVRKLVGGHCEVCGALWPQHRIGCWRDL